MLNWITGLTIAGSKQMMYVSYKINFLWKLIMVAFIVFWLVMLFNCLQRKFKTDMDKVAWIILLVFIPVVGAFLYLVSLYYKPKNKKKK